MTSYLNENGLIRKPRMLYKATCIQIRLELPITNACVSLLSAIDYAWSEFEKNIDFYAGLIGTPSGKLFSETLAFDPIIDALDKLKDAMSLYEVGSVPFHSEIMNKASVLFREFLLVLRESFKERTKRIALIAEVWTNAVGDLSRTLNDKRCTQEVWNEQLKKAFEHMKFNLFQVRKFIREFEENALFKSARPATLEEVKEVVTTAADSVTQKVEEAKENIIDELQRREAQVIAEIESFAAELDKMATGVAKIAKQYKSGNQRKRKMQDICFSLWEIGQKNHNIKAAIDEYTTPQEATFNYYRKPLETIGIKSADAFKEQLRKRSKRISKEKNK